MDTELKCNRLTCRRILTDKAVVTTCSHIFCVDCANELFNAARLCPACETSLTEPDDVVVSSLHPSNDYKTSVLSGLNPAIILEICGRAVSFWQYQLHQESSFQQAVVRNVNDKNAQLQKQVDSVVREANSEISLLNNKIAELERDLELERRKLRDVQETARERDKEYQKLKNQYDKVKRKALLQPGASGLDIPAGFATNSVERRGSDDQLGRNKGTISLVPNLTGGAVNIGAVAGGMEANGIQRTPVANRTAGGALGGTWQQPQSATRSRLQPQRHPFAPPNRSFGARSVSDRSDSAQEVENMVLGNTSHVQSRGGNHPGPGWAVPRNRPFQHVVAPPSAKRKATGFRPAGVPR